MDPLTLLRELFGEEPIRKVVTSGFDSVHKIAAATPESLSFFSGINEVTARQIVASAEESLAGPPPASYRDSLAGSSEGRTVEEPVLPVKPRLPPPPRAPTARREREESDLLDESPLLDAGGILKTVAMEPLPKNLLEDGDFLDEVGLSDAEANFLEGISPWPGEKPRREKASSAPLEARPPDLLPASPPEEKEVEYAPISDWSPEEDPDPKPRLVRAPELGPGPAAENAPEREVSVVPVFGQPEPPWQGAGAEIAAVRETEPAASAETLPAPEPSTLSSSLWRFGK